VNEVAIRLHIEALDQGGYVATSPDVQGLVAEGRTMTECVEIAQGVARKIEESCIEHGDPLPEIFLKPRVETHDFTIPVQLA
jgi:antitoxin HicB